jgi:hypothetical protein
MMSDPLKNPWVVDVMAIAGVLACLVLLVVGIFATMMAGRYGRPTGRSSSPSYTPPVPRQREPNVRTIEFWETQYGNEPPQYDARVTYDDGTVRSKSSQRGLPLSSAPPPLTITHI